MFNAFGAPPLLARLSATRTVSFGGSARTGGLVAWHRDFAAWGIFELTTFATRVLVLHLCNYFLVRTLELHKKLLLLGRVSQLCVDHLGIPCYLCGLVGVGCFVS